MLSVKGSYRTSKAPYKLGILFIGLVYQLTVPASPAPWQLTLARIDGALPFVSPQLGQTLALASLRRLWRIHVRDFSFENAGLEHNPGLDADELVRSWYAAERRDFLSWIVRRAPPALAAAARMALAAKNSIESFSSDFAPADAALDRLDALLPSDNPVATLLDLIAILRTEEIDFLEGRSEIVEFEGIAITRPAPRGAAWAASLAVAMRPHLFGLGSAPIALAGVLPRALFREMQEDPLPVLLQLALQTACEHAADDLYALHGALVQGDAMLADRNASSTAPQAWRVIRGLGPLTRAELARGLGVTKRTASLAVLALEQLDLVRLRPADNSIFPVRH